VSDFNDEAMQSYPFADITPPLNWCLVALEEISTDVSPGFASGKHNTDGAGVPHLRPMNVDRGGQIDLNVVKSVAGSNGIELRPGDVLFNNTNSAELIGKTAAVSAREAGFAFSNHMTRIRLEFGVNSVFAARQLHLLWMTGYMKHRCTNHVNQASISSKTLAKTIPFLLPPRAEQTRIVAKLEELLSDLDAGVAELKAAQKKLAQYRQSLLKAAVEGALTAEWRAQRSAPPLPNPSPSRGEGLEPETGAILAPLPPRGGGAGGEGAHSSQLTTPTQQGHARALRSAQTPTEHALWQQLRAKRFGGFKFRRQQPLGRYIVDFVCFEQRLIVELDGGQHADQQNYDAARDAWLQAQGYRVLRFWNNAWHAQQDAVLDAVWCALHDEAPPLPNPSPARGEGLEPETGAQLLARILTERRARWEAKQLARFQQQGKVPPKGWQTKYPEPVQPDTSGLPELPQGWVWSALGESFQVEVGATPSRKESGYWDGGIPWVSSGEVRFSRITQTKETISEAGLRNSSTQINPVGSVLLGMIGEGKTRGQVAILDVEATNNQNCAAIWVSASGVPPEYVYYWLWSQYEVTRRGSSGNNQPALNKAIVERIPFPLAPLTEMRAIVQLVDCELDRADEQERAIELALKQSTAQRQNILRAAFAGQLVPQDPNDEPASVLLERIRAERAATPKPRGRKARERA
jgi:type I restriction enzyme S subunit